jgi:predicted dehydrogenase
MFAEVHRLAMFNPRGTDVSVVLDLMIHDLDIILKLMGNEVVDVQASGVAIVSSTSDIANARITFKSGAVVNVTASRISMKNMRKIRLFQPDAYLSLDFLKKKTEVIRLHESEPEGVENLMALETEKGQRFIELSMPEAPANNAIKEELESFAKSIIENTPSKVDLDDGLNALKLAYQIEAQIQAHLAKVNVSR